MLYKYLYGILCYAYRSGARKAIVERISDPNSDWDDKALELLDTFFMYTEE